MKFRDIVEGKINEAKFIYSDAEEKLKNEGWWDSFLTLKKGLKKTHTIVMELNNDDKIIELSKMPLEKYKKMAHASKSWEDAMVRIYESSEETLSEAIEATGKFEMMPNGLEVMKTNNFTAVKVHKLSAVKNCKVVQDVIAKGGKIKRSSDKEVSFKTGKEEFTFMFNNKKDADIFFDYMRTQKSINENIEEINNSGIGYIISYSIFMVAQTHMWHLLCPNGQKHMALGEFYEELQDEVDELAERFLAQGGQLVTINEPLVAQYDEFAILKACEQFRSMVTSAIDTNPNMASIVDGVADIQELIDQKLYKFKLQ